MSITDINYPNGENSILSILDVIGVKVCNEYADFFVQLDLLIPCSLRLQGDNCSERENFQGNRIGSFSLNLNLK